MDGKPFWPEKETASLEPSSAFERESSEVFEQKGLSPQLTCNDTVSVSVRPYYDASLRPQSEGDYQSVSVKVSGQEAQILALEDVFWLSENCRLFGFSVFEYQNQKFGVRGKVETGAQQ